MNHVGQDYRLARTFRSLHLINSSYNHLVCQGFKPPSSLATYNLTFEHPGKPQPFQSIPRLYTASEGDGKHGPQPEVSQTYQDNTPMSTSRLSYARSTAVLTETAGIDSPRTNTTPRVVRRSGKPQTPRRHMLFLLDPLVHPPRPSPGEMGRPGNETAAGAKAAACISHAHHAMICKSCRTTAPTCSWLILKSAVFYSLRGSCTHVGLAQSNLLLRHQRDSQYRTVPCTPVRKALGVRDLSSCDMVLLPPGGGSFLVLPPSRTQSVRGDTTCST